MALSDSVGRLTRVFVVDVRMCMTSRSIGQVICPMPRA